jgi:FixJ family two-component response regulator
MSSHLEEFTERMERFCASTRNSESAALVNSQSSADLGHTSDHLRNELIAIVDDDRWAREGISSFIASLGYVGATFTSAEEYLDSDLKQRAQCLILDVQLTGMSGPDLQARLLADGYFTPIIFVTGRFDDDVQHRVMGAGAFGYLTKPFDENSLINCLERAVNS